MARCCFRCLDISSKKTVDDLSSLISDNTKVLRHDIKWISLLISYFLNHIHFLRAFIIISLLIRTKVSKEMASKELLCNSHLSNTTLPTATHPEARTEPLIERIHKPNHELN